MKIVNISPFEIDRFIASAHKDLELVRIKDVERILGARKSKIYSDAAAGLFPKPLTIGAMSRWPKYEALAVAALRVSGGDDDAVRALVARLNEARTTLATSILRGVAA